MKDLSFPQRQILANFCTNVAVGWFVVGVITSFFSQHPSITELYVRASIALIMIYIFLKIGVSLLEE